MTVRYNGQHQTCARCHGTAQHCPGKGIAKNCQAAGGLKVELPDYLLKLWKEIGYTPGESDLKETLDDINEAGAEVDQQDGGQFTRVKSASDPSLFSGVNIKTLPRDTDHGQIVEFHPLCKHNSVHRFLWRRFGDSQTNICVVVVVCWC